jgi:hypothetical protein
MGSRGAAQRRDRQIQAHAVPVRQGIEDAGQVVARPGGQVGDQARPARIVPGRECPHRLGERPVVTSAQEGVARRDHDGGVAGAGSRPARGEVDISVPCDIEAVLAAAGQPAAGELEPAGADRAAQVRGDRGERAEPRSL